MILVITGPQGSGKGTQAKLIAKEFRLFHMQSGEMLREMAKNDQRIREMINQGIIVPDQETLSYIESYIEKKHGQFNNIIFDGYPRNINQYNLLISLTKKESKQIDKIIYLDISDKEAIRRLSARRVCEKCGAIYNLITNPPSKKGECVCGNKLTQREDDVPEAIKNRLSIFHKQTKPVLERAETDGILLKVDGERPIDVIFGDILEKLKDKK
jgi:adenylate kinase